MREQICLTFDPTSCQCHLCCSSHNQSVYFVDVKCPAPTQCTSNNMLLIKTETAISLKFDFLSKEHQISELMKHSGDSSQQLSLLNEQLVEKDRLVFYWSPWLQRYHGNSWFTAHCWLEPCDWP